MTSTAAKRPAGALARVGFAKRKLLVLLVVVLGLLLFAPTIVLQTPLRQKLLAGIVPTEAGNISADSLTVGWLTPVSAKDVKLVDPNGNRLAEIGQLSIDRTVIGFMTFGDNLGTIKLKDVTLYALVDPSGSNLERAIAAMSAAQPTTGEQLPSSSGGTSYQLQIENGRLLSRDISTGATWSAESITATVDHPSGGALGIEANGLVRPAPPELGGPAIIAGQPKQGRFEFQWGEDSSQALNRVRVVCKDLPVAAVEPWLKRFDTKTKDNRLTDRRIGSKLPNGTL